MTNKEAIELIQEIEEDGRNVTSKHIEALDLAIKALEERPHGDLISRTWLKEHKFTTQVCNGVEIEDVDVVAVATIDNAQTVESDKDLYEKIETYKNAYRIMSDAFENEVRKNKRPQGEWGKWIISVIKCPDCLECFHFPTEHYSMEMLKECPNCGADMRKDNRLTKEQLENVWDSGYVKTEVEDWYEEGD